MRQKIGRVCMVLGALLILAAAALLAYNKWDASRADKASQEVLGELEQTLNAAIEEKAKSDTVALQPELDPTQEMTVTELNGWDAMNPGHFDQHLAPFYEKEIASGTLTGDEPVELCGPENRTGPLLRFHLCG